VTEAAAGAGSHRRLVLVGVLAGTFLGTFNNSVANVAVVDVIDDFGVDVDVAAWFITGYVLGFAVLLPAAGRLVDAYGTRRVYLTGMTGFVVASALVAVAPSFGAAAGARVLQGVVNAPVLPTVMVTVTALYPPAARGRALGIWASVNGAAIALGPPLGGVVADALGWRAIFWLDVPLALAVLAVGIRWLPDTERRRDAVDVAGGALLSVGLVLVMVALSQGSAWGWADPSTLTLVAAGAALLAALWWRSHSVPAPFVDLGVLRNRAYGVLACVAGLQMVVLFAALFAVPLLLVTRFDHSVAEAGWLSFLLPATMVVAGPGVGALADRRGARALMSAGAALLAVAAALLGAGAAREHLAVVLLALVVLGAGVAAIQSPSAARVAEAVEERHRGVAMGLFHTIRFLSGIVGTAVSAALFAAVTGGVDVEAVADDVLGRAFVADFAFAAAAAVLALVAARLVQDRSPALPTPALRAEPARS